jgi:NADH-quinone oxidoreductase subunit C
VAEPLTPAMLREHLARHFPDALVATPARVAEPGPAKKGEHAPANLLATNDPVIIPERLVDAATLLRNQFGYELLSNLTATDYLADGIIELVYHFSNLSSGPPAILKVRLPREQPELPSLTPIWPGAGLQEREAFDLFGVVFTGHPYLRRVYMWDEFEGFPMRKDFPKQGDKYFEGAEG